MSDFKDSLGGLDDVDLGGLDEAAREAKPIQGGNEPPDGTYVCEVVKCNVKAMGANKNPAVSWQLRILEPSHIDGVGKVKGRMLFRTDWLASKDGDREKTKKAIGHFKGALKNIEIEDIQSGEDSRAWLHRVTNEAIGLVVKVQKKTNGNFVNVNLLKKLGSTLDGSYITTDEDEFPPQE